MVWLKEEEQDFNTEVLTDDSPTGSGSQVFPGPGGKCSRVHLLQVLQSRSSWRCRAWIWRKIQKLLINERYYETREVPPGDKGDGQDIQKSPQDKMKLLIDKNKKKTPRRILWSKKNTDMNKKDSRRKLRTTILNNLGIVRRLIQIS